MSKRLLPESVLMFGGRETREFPSLFLYTAYTKH